jgi:hypothetical protein
MAFEDRDNAAFFDDNANFFVSVPGTVYLIPGVVE